MRKPEFLEMAGRVADLWPNQGWPADSLDSSFELFRGVDAQAALKAVQALAEAGERFAPVPGQVLAQARAFFDVALMLPPPDVTRDLTPEELERAQRRGAQLRAQLAQLANPKAMAGS